MCFFFFFQAEDGIRDGRVTGVQTCALPISSTAGLAILLNEGVGDTIRVSLTPEPGAPREREVEIAQQVLQSMGLRSFLPQVSACPGCGRTTSTYFQEMAQQIQGYLKDQMPIWRET